LPSIRPQWDHARRNFKNDITASTGRSAPDFTVRHYGGATMKRPLFLCSAKCRDWHKADISADPRVPAFGGKANIRHPLLASLN
jgi:hypothetical protein